MPFIYNFIDQFIDYKLTTLDYILKFFRSFDHLFKYIV